MGVFVEEEDVNNNSCSRSNGGYTQDGSVDLKGKPILRSKTGGWTACSFLVLYEMFERMAYYGISSNLVIYLTKKLNQGTVTSSNNVNNWVGTVWITPILGGFVADAFLGRYWTFLISSAIYLLGMVALTMTVSLPELKPPQCVDPVLVKCEKASTLQLAMFYGSLYTLAVGTGGTKPNISTIGADQFDDFDPKEKAQKFSFFNWWMFSIFLGTFFANTILVYVQDNVGWALGYGLPTLGLAISIVIFLVGTPFYRHKFPTGSPFTRMAQVIVASFKKWSIPIPKDPKQFYELDLKEYNKKRKYKIDSTLTLRFLNKACVKTGPTNPWMLCSITQVEEAKQILRLIPLLVFSTFVPVVTISQVSTLFIKQGTTLQRDIGKFKIPPGSLTAFVTLSMLICIVIYDKIFVNIIKKWTKNPRGITLIQRLGIGMILYTVVMVIASLVEMHRLRVAKDHGVFENGGQVPLSIFVLLPQLVLTGMADAFFEVAKLEFFYDQAPESMKSLGTSLSLNGVGCFLSSFLLSTVSRVTKKNGHHGWILDNLNESRLDYYYAFLTILNILNFGLFLVVQKRYQYKPEVSDSVAVLEEELRGSRAIAANNIELVMVK